jgi:hypothetical protein
VSASRTKNAWLLVAGSLVVGCGDDGGDNGRVDLDLDARAPFDSGNNLPRNDGGLDASHVEPKRDADTSVVICAFTRSEIAEVANSAVSVADPIALAVRNDGASLSWIAYEMGAPRLWTQWFGSDRTSTFSPDSDGGTATQREPGNIATGSGFLTVWSDDEGGPDLIAQGAGADGQLTAPHAVKLSSDGASTRERTPVLAPAADGKLLAVWQNAGTSRGTALLLDATGAAVGVPHAIENYPAQSMQPALAALGSRFVLAWVDPVLQRVHMVLLDGTGAPLGSDVLVDVEANASGTVDLATSEAGGAIVFDVQVAGVRPEVRFRTFDTSGALTGVERAITSAPSTGSSPSIVPIAGGYIVAYRSVKAPDLQLQLALLDSSGEVTGGISVAPVLDNDLPIALRIAPDGRQMFLSWMDRVSGTAAYNLQRTWVTCD